MNIGTVIDAAAAGAPGRVALVIDGQSVTYGELAKAVEQCGGGLAARGLAGKRIAVVDLASLLFDGLLARRGKTNERRQ